MRNCCKGTQYFAVGKEKRHEMVGEQKKRLPTGSLFMIAFRVDYFITTFLPFWMATPRKPAATR